MLGPKDFDLADKPTLARERAPQRQRATSDRHSPIPTAPNIQLFHCKPLVFLSTVFYT
jgi:hypothetical protein